MKAKEKELVCIQLNGKGVLTDVYVAYKVYYINHRLVEQYRYEVIGRYAMHGLKLVYVPKSCIFNTGDVYEVNPNKLPFFKVNFYHPDLDYKHLVYTTQPIKYLRNICIANNLNPHAVVFDLRNVLGKVIAVDSNVFADPIYELNRKYYEY